MFIVCVEKPVRMMTALVLLILSALPFRSPRVRLMSKASPPSRRQSTSPQSTAYQLTGEAGRHANRRRLGSIMASGSAFLLVHSGLYARHLLVGVEDLNLILRVVLGTWRGVGLVDDFKSAPMPIPHRRGSQSALGLLPETRTVPSGRSVADEWYIRGIVDTPALDHRLPFAAAGS